MNEQEINLEKDKTVNQTYKVSCIKCKRETNHKVIASIDIRGKQEIFEDEFFEWMEIYQIIQCLGCDEMSFRIEESNSEDIDPIYGYTIYEKLYPLRGKDTISGKKYMNLPYNLKFIYKEVIDSYNNNILILCAVGVRALVEGICVNKNIKKGPVLIKQKDGSTQTVNKTNLEGMINGLHEKKILNEENANILHNHRFLGNSAVHELSIPSKKELYLSIQIIEAIMESIYEIPAKGLQLKYAMQHKNNT